jgi:hypothetical protein
MQFLNKNITTSIQNVDGYISLYQDGLLGGYFGAYAMNIDTRNGGDNKNQIWMRGGNHTDDLLIARDIIAGNGTIFYPQAILVATWYKVEAFDKRPGQQNTFQLALPYSETGETWGILAYTQLQFFKADIGPNASVYYYNIPTTFQQTIAVTNATEMNRLLNGTNCNRPGIYAFRINKGAPTKAPTRAPTKPPTKAPTKSPIVAPTRARCGLLGWRIFCPFTLCGFFGRWLGFCQTA